MGLGNELRKAGNLIRKRRGRDSYLEYKRKREDDRRVARQEREETERGPGQSSED